MPAIIYVDENQPVPSQSCSQSATHSKSNRSQSQPTPKAIVTPPIKPVQVQTQPPPQTKPQVFGARVINILRDMRIDTHTVDVAVDKLMKEENIFSTERAPTVIEIALDRAIHFTGFATVYVKFLKKVIEKQLEFGAEDFPFKKTMLLNEYQQLIFHVVNYSDSDYQSTQNSILFPKLFKKQCCICAGA